MSYDGGNPSTIRDAIKRPFWLYKTKYEMINEMFRLRFELEDISCVRNGVTNEIDANFIIIT